MELVGSSQPYIYHLVLKTGLTLTSFGHSIGTSPTNRNHLKMMVRIGATLSASFFNTLGLVLSGPAAIYGFRFLIS